MRTFPFLVFCVGCVSHAMELTQSPPTRQFEAWVWVGEPHETFLLTAHHSAVTQFASLAEQIGHELRPATDADFRQSWPTLRVLTVTGPRGETAYEVDLSAAQHVALVNLWVELMAVREWRREVLDPAPEAFVQHAVYSTRPRSRD